MKLLLPFAVIALLALPSASAAPRSVDVLEGGLRLYADAYEDTLPGEDGYVAVAYADSNLVPVNASALSFCVWRSDLTLALCPYTVAEARVAGERHGVLLICLAIVAENDLALCLPAAYSGDTVAYVLPIYYSDGWFPERGPRVCNVTYLVVEGTPVIQRFDCVRAHHDGRCALVAHGVGPGTWLPPPETSTARACATGEGSGARGCVEGQAAGAGQLACLGARVEKIGSETCVIAEREVGGPSTVTRVVCVR